MLTQVYQCHRFNGTTGSLVDIFVPSGSGGLSSPTGVRIGPDGNLYVSSYVTSQVLRYNGTTGAFMDVFASGGGLGEAHGITFGPDGNLYVADATNSQVLRYNGATGAFMDVFVTPGSGGVSLCVGLAFGPDDNLYLNSYNTQQILRYNGTTGAFMDVFASASGCNAAWITFAYPFPVLTGLSPASRNAAGPAFTLTVKGASFQPFSTINWNGTPLTTSYMTSTALKAAVPAAFITSPGKATITVVTSSGGTSSKKTFMILLTTLKNVGYLTAPNVTIKQATLNAVNTSTTLPVTVGSITAGSTSSTPLTFPSSVGTSGTVVSLKVSGTFNGGKFSGSLKVTLP